MTTPDDRFRPGPPSGGPDDASSAPPGWSVGDRPGRDGAVPGYGTAAPAAPAGTAADDLDAAAPPPAATGGRRGEGLLVAALFTAAGAMLVLALAVGALAVAVGLGGGSRDFGYVADGSGDDAVAGAETYGDDPALDDLWDACDAGDGGACDDLYFQTDSGTEYEEFGWTCGERYDLSRDPGTCPAQLD